MTTSALWDVPEPCGCVLSRTEGHRCLPPFGDEPSELDRDSDLRPHQSAQGYETAPAGTITLEHDQLCLERLSGTDRPTQPEDTQ